MFVPFFAVLHLAWATQATDQHYCGELGEHADTCGSDITPTRAASLLQGEVRSGTFQQSSRLDVASFVPANKTLTKSTNASSEEGPPPLIEEAATLAFTTLSVVGVAVALATLRSFLFGRVVEANSFQSSKQDTSESDKTADVEEIPIMEEKMDSLTLFIDAWSKVAPVLFPVAFIIFLNNQDVFKKEAPRDHSFIMNCAHNTDFVAALCSYSRPSVRLFPIVSAVAAVVMGAWKMVHTRVYYVLMKHRVLISFPVSKRLGFYLFLAMTLVYMVLVFHFILILLYDWPCDDEETCGKERFLNNTIWELIKDPKLLVSEQNKYLVPFAQKYVTLFLVPGALILVFLKGMDNFVDNLVPMDLYFQRDAQKRYRALGSFVVVPESSARRIVNDMVERDVYVTDISQACQKFKQVAVVHDCVILGGTDQKDGAQSSDSGPQRGLLTKLKDGIIELLFLDWWPAKLLLNFDLADDESRAFSAATVSYLSQTIVIVILMASLTFRRFLVLASGDGLDLSKGFDNRAFDRIFEASVPAVSCCLQTIILSSVILHILGPNFYARKTECEQK